MKEFMTELTIGSAILVILIVLLREVILEIKINKTISIGSTLIILLSLSFLIIFSKIIALSFSYKEVIGITKGIRKTINKGVSIKVMYEYTINNKTYYGSTPKPNYKIDFESGKYWVRVSTLDHNNSWMDFKKKVD